MNNQQRSEYQSEVMSIAQRIKKSRGDRFLQTGDREAAAELIIKRDGLQVTVSDFLRQIMVASNDNTIASPVDISTVLTELARLTALVESVANAPALPPEYRFSGAYVSVVADQKRGYVIRGKYAPKSHILDTTDLEFANNLAKKIDEFVSTRRGQDGAK